MKKFGLLALVLCVALFTFGCPEQKKEIKVGPPAGSTQVQPGGDEKKADEAAPAGEKKTDEAMPPAGEKKPE